MKVKNIRTWQSEVTKRPELTVEFVDFSESETLVLRGCLERDSHIYLTSKPGVLFGSLPTDTTEPAK